MILAGGKGTRFKEETKDIPKPMVLANDEPLLVHIMNIYLKFGINNIVVLAGYKKGVIVDYFSKYSKLISNEENKFKFKSSSNVTVLDTGKETLTGGRIKIGLEYVDEEQVYITYGDGLANINIKELTKFHKENKKLATLTAVKPPPRFGNIKISDNLVTKFEEKSSKYENWINGGFFIINKAVGNYITNTNQPFEREPLQSLTSKGELAAYKHAGLFRPVDTIHELKIVEKDIKNNLFD